MAGIANNSLPMLIAGLGLGIALGVGGTTLVADVSSSGGDRESSSASNQAADNSQEPSVMALTAEKLIETSRPQLVEGCLTDRPIAVLHTEDAESTVVDSIKELIDAAGGSVAADITLNSSLFDPKKDAQVFAAVKNSLPTSVKLPAKSAPGARVATALGAALLLDKDTGEALVQVPDRAKILTGLSAEKAVSYTPGTVLPAQAMVIITGDITPGDTSQRLSTMARTLDAMSDRVVVAGQVSQAGEEGVIGKLRAIPESPVSTVDTVAYPAGQVVTILALSEQFEGGSGAYGAASNAGAPMPAL